MSQRTRLVVSVCVVRSRAVLMQCVSGLCKAVPLDGANKSIPLVMVI